MKNVTTGVELQLTDGVIDHIVGNMSKAQLRDTCRRLLREARDGRMDADSYASLAFLRVESETARREIRAAVGTPVSEGLPEPGEPVQIIIDATFGERRDRWLVEKPFLRPVSPDMVTAWRPAWAGNEATLMRAVLQADADEVREASDE